MTGTLHGAVLGHPIGHSKSPALHRAAYRLLGLDFSYEAIDTTNASFPALLDRVRAERTWYGLSVTMPLKNDAAALVDELTPTARLLDSVNTVVVTGTDDGGTHLLGDNTDVAGLVNALRHAGVGRAPRVAVLGGGGTAVSAVAAAARLGAPAIDVFLRNPAKAGPTRDVAEALGLAHAVRGWDEAARALAGFDVVMSTLPPHGADALAGELAGATAGTGGPAAGRFLLDAAYDPWPSALAATWSRLGGVIVPGIEMLLYQGVEQVKMFARAGGGAAAVAAARERDVINVMCDAIGLARR
ncbi:shikimate dehydrogenase [Specibacter cremeus]|uniref:shikimate dehydrogenase n=1 Tax=Specibacter cremeus TaxID=1629051 RepID=UPI000F7987CC|nr:shikimate dehydrogenase [Specibacter cremeus]